MLPLPVASYPVYRATHHALHVLPCCRSTQLSSNRPLAVGHPLESVSRHWRSQLRLHIEMPCAGFWYSRFTALALRRFLAFASALHELGSLSMNKKVPHRHRKESLSCVQFCNWLSHRQNAYPWIQKKRIWKPKQSQKHSKVCDETRPFPWRHENGSQAQVTHRLTTPHIRTLYLHRRTFRVPTRKRKTFSRCRKAMPAVSLNLRRVSLS